jgi:hypothetical protein
VVGYEENETAFLCKERIDMTQSELWLTKWQEAVDFLETNHRKPSKFVPEEIHWLGNPSRKVESFLIPLT